MTQLYYDPIETEIDIEEGFKLTSEIPDIESEICHSNVSASCIYRVECLSSYRPIYYVPVFIYIFFIYVYIYIIVLTVLHRLSDSDTQFFRQPTPVLHTHI